MNHPSENASPKNSSTTFEAFSLLLVTFRFIHTDFHARDRRHGVELLQAALPFSIDDMMQDLMAEHGSGNPHLADITNAVLWYWDADDDGKPRGPGPRLIAPEAED